MNKLLSMLGLCKKAGKITLGFDPVVDTLGKGATLILYSKDASEKTIERMDKKISEYNIKSIKLELKASELAFVLTREPAVMSITDKGLSEQIIKLNEAAKQEVNS